MTTKRIIVEVRGGLVQAVYGDPGVEVTIVDWDTEAEDPVVVASEEVLPLDDMPKETRKAMTVSDALSNS